MDCQGHPVSRAQTPAARVTVGDERPHEQDLRPQASTQHALLRRPERVVHRVRGDGLRAKCDTGQAVCEQVDPEDLGGEQRQRHSQEGAE
jgi:hypothetical protein